jgi:hypothetical protein
VLAVLPPIEGFFERRARSFLHTDSSVSQKHPR